MKKDPKRILFWVFHIIMKILPSAIMYITVLTYRSYEEYPFICKGIFLVFFCYAIGSCIWDYFNVKKLKAGEKVNFIPQLVIDILQFVTAAVIFGKHFMLLAEVEAYNNNYFEFFKEFFADLKYYF